MRKTLALIALFAAFFALSAQAANKPSFVKLFNGRNLDGWVLVGGKGPGYIVQRGNLVCPPSGGGNLFTEKEYANFVFRFEFRLSKGSNNGIGIRAPLKGDAAYVGMEIQVLDDPAPQYADLRPGQYHGSIYDVFPAKRGFLKKTGEWNREEITANGRHVKIVLNGTTIVDADLDTVKDPAVLKRHPGLARTTGRIGFLGHDSGVEFRKIEVQELP